MKANEIISATNFLMQNIDEDKINVSPNGSVITKDEMIANIVQKCLTRDSETTPLVSSSLFYSNFQKTVATSDFLSGSFSKEFNFGVASFKIDLEYDISSKSGKVTVNSSIFGFNLGASSYEIANGVLIKSENLDLGIVKVGYDFDIDFLNRFNGGIMVHGEINLGFYKKSGSWKLDF